MENLDVMSQELPGQAPAFRERSAARIGRKTFSPALRRKWLSVEDVNHLLRRSSRGRNVGPWLETSSSRNRL